MKLVPLLECSWRVTSAVTGNGRLGLVALLAPHPLPCGRERPGGFSLLLPTQWALLAHCGLGAGWGGSEAMGTQHGADKLAWLSGSMGRTAPGEARPPQGRSWVFLQIRTEQVMLVSRQHIRLGRSQQWWEAGGKGAGLRHHSTAVQASSGQPSLHDRGGLQQQPPQRWQHKGPNPMLSP